MKATKQFYVGRGMTVTKSVGSMYVEFAPGRSHPVKMALYKRRGLAKDLGVTDDGTGAHHIVVNGTGASFTDLDGFVWEGGK